jgi:hypothetical protein
MIHHVHNKRRECCVNSLVMSYTIDLKYVIHSISLSKKIRVLFIMAFAFGQISIGIIYSEEC